MIVSDANLISALIIRNDQTPLAESVYQMDDVWLAPPLWYDEFLSVLSKHLRFGGLQLKQAKEYLELALELLDEHVRSPSSDAVFEILLHSKLTSYDSEYVALAKELGIRLVTFDAQILREFPGLAVLPQDFVTRK